MGVLSNFDHERFCQLAHKRIWAGEKQVEACEAAYRDAICEGAENTKPTDFAANVRKLRNRPEIKARLQELADYAAKLAGIDAGWAQLKLRDMVEANLDDYLSPTPDDGGNRFLTIGEVSREKLGLLTELSQEETTELAGKGKLRDVRKIRIKLPDKIQALGLMAKIAGWLAPERREVSGQMTLENLVAASMKPKQDAA
jgi:hypothetical protein